MNTRYRGAYQTLTYDFIDEISVICPNCSKKGLVQAKNFSFQNTKEKDIRFICSYCGLNKMLSESPSEIVYSSNSETIQGRHYVFGGGIDPFFHLPLWFTDNIAENLFWAYNLSHLEFLQNHIEAKLRERNGIPMRNKSLGSRLPKWMTSKKNRETILKAISKLRKK